MLSWSSVHGHGVPACEDIICPQREYPGPETTKWTPISQDGPVKAITHVQEGILHVFQTALDRSGLPCGGQPLAHPKWYSSPVSAECISVRVFPPVI